MKAMKQLENDGLGTLKEKKSKRTVKVNNQANIIGKTHVYNFRLENSTK